MNIQKENFRTSYILYLAIIFLIFIIVTYLWNRIGSNLGSLGDSFNGITAPVLTLFSVILIRMAFLEQKKSNEILLNDSKFAHDMEWYRTYESKINKLENEIINFKLEDTTIEYITINQPNEKLIYSGYEALILASTSFILYFSNDVFLSPERKYNIRTDDLKVMSIFRQFEVLKDSKYAISNTTLKEMLASHIKDLIDGKYSYFIKTIGTNAYYKLSKALRENTVTMESIRQKFPNIYENWSDEDLRKKYRDMMGENSKYISLKLFLSSFILTLRKLNDI